MSTLVAIGDSPTLTGTSPELGVMQTIDVRCMPRLIAFAARFHSVFGKPLVVTEASRSRPRQLALYQAHQRDPLHTPLAATPYTSRHDEILRGNAGDLGSGVASRYSSESVWARTYGPEYGIEPTGMHFSSIEPWHYDLSVAPFTDPHPSTTPASTTVTPHPATPNVIPDENEDTMKSKFFIVNDGSALYVGAPGAKKLIHIEKIETLVALRQILATGEAGPQSLPVVQEIERIMVQLPA
jgi:hypothetical protein